MKLRIARKIVMSSEKRKDSYSESTLQRAHIRWSRCKSAKEDKAYWNELIVEARSIVEYNIKRYKC
jgi:hypothetical protein